MDAVLFIEIRSKIKLVNFSENRQELLNRYQYQSKEFWKTFSLRDSSFFVYMYNLLYDGQFDRICFYRYSNSGSH